MCRFRVLAETSAIVAEIFVIFFCLSMQMQGKYFDQSTILWRPSLTLHPVIQFCMYGVFMPTTSRRRIILDNSFVRIQCKVRHETKLTIINICLLSLQENFHLLSVFVEEGSVAGTSRRSRKKAAPTTYIWYLTLCP
jgi:hypothetical protein